MTKSISKEKFEGFPLPQYTQIPNIIIDHIMPYLKGNEFKILMYIARRTLGFHKPQDTISLSQLVRGMKTSNGKTLNGGTGLGKATVARLLNNLERMGYVVRTRRVESNGKFLPTTYSLKFKQDTPLSHFETTPVSKEDNPLSQNETDKINDKQKKQQQNQKDIAALLISKGVEEDVARKLSSLYLGEYIMEKVSHLDYLIEEEPNSLTNPPGRLRRSIEENWAPPKGFKTKEQRKAEKQAKEKARIKRIENKQKAEQQVNKDLEQLYKSRLEHLTSLHSKYQTSQLQIANWKKFQNKLVSYTEGSLSHYLANTHLLRVQDDTIFLVAPTKFIVESIYQTIKPQLGAFDVDGISIKDLQIGYWLKDEIHGLEDVEGVEDFETSPS